MGSTMYGSLVGTEVRKKDIVVEHAKDFLNQYYASIRRYEIIIIFYLFIYQRNYYLWKLSTAFQFDRNL